MAIALAAVLVIAALGGGKDEAAGLDSARLQQNMPMHLAGLAGEGGRDRNDIGSRLGKCAVEIGEAHVIANGHAESAPRRRRNNTALAGPEGARFPVALAAFEIDVEHMDLVVDRNRPAPVIQQERAIDSPFVIQKLDHQGSGQKPDAEFRRDLAIGGKGRFLILGLDNLGTLAPAALHQIDDFGQADQLRALAVGFPDKFRRKGDIPADVGGRGELRASDFQYVGHADFSSIESNLPSASNA